MRAVDQPGPVHGAAPGRDDQRQGAVLLVGGQQRVLQPTAAAAAQGAYYPSQIPPLDQNNPATTTFETNLEAVRPVCTRAAYPSFGATGAYLAAELMVKGLQEAGQNPTRQSVHQQPHR